MVESEEYDTGSTQFRAEMMWRFGLIWTLVVLMTLVVATSSVDTSELEGAKITLTITFGLILMVASVIVPVLERLGRKYDWIGGILNVD